MMQEKSPLVLAIVLLTVTMERGKEEVRKEIIEKNKDKLVTTEDLIKEEEMPNDNPIPPLKRKYAWESDEKKDDAEYVRGRRVKTINESDDSDLEDNFMNEFIIDSELNFIFNNSDICNSCKNYNSYNKIFSCNNIKRLNKNKKLVAEPTNYFSKCFDNFNYSYHKLKSSEIDSLVDSLKKTT